MLIFYIKKNGLFLANSNTKTYEYEYDEYSDINANSTVQFEWTEDENEARTFADMRTAKTFVAKKRGNFWKGAEVIRK